MSSVRYLCCRHCKHICLCDPPCPGMFCPLPGGHWYECPQCQAELLLFPVLGRDLMEFYAGTSLPG